MPDVLPQGPPPGTQIKSVRHELGNVVLVIQKGGGTPYEKWLTPGTAAERISAIADMLKSASARGSYLYADEERRDGRLVDDTRRAIQKALEHIASGRLIKPIPQGIIMSGDDVWDTDELAGLDSRL